MFLSVMCPLCCLLCCCCVCICYRGNVSTELLSSNDRGMFTEPLPSNDKGIHIQTQRDWRDFLIGPLRWAQVP
jgi:hypothetical protein